MTRVYVGVRPVTLAARDLIGKGGEADIYSIGSGKALKLYKQPNHPDFQSANTAESLLLQQAAIARLAVQQTKLASFPAILPPNVLGPQEIALDNPGGKGRVVGYTMRYLDHADMLFQYGRRQFRESAAARGVSDDHVLDLLLSLHDTIKGVHAAGVVIGDFNDLNVLVQDGKVYLVDADSFQFGGYVCSTFQLRFVDPLLCDPTLDRLEMRQPHGQGSDWYAYACMVMRCLAFVEPYGGAYKPSNPKCKVPDSIRALRRISIFHPDVQYPRPALPMCALPGEIVDFWRRTFERDERGEFPRALLEELRWVRCGTCGAQHARSRCPFCFPAGLRIGANAALATDTSFGQTVVCELIFQTDGYIAQAAVLDGKLRWLAAEQGALKREQGDVVLRGTLGNGVSVVLGKGETHLAKGGSVASISPGREVARRTVDVARGVAAIAANSRHDYWIADGVLYRSGDISPVLLGEVLPHQTRIWVGESFGLGLYDAGALSGVVLFDAEHPGILDGLAVRLPRGQILDASCTFGDGIAWLLVSAQDGHAIYNYCFAISRNGKVLAECRIHDGDNSWLGSMNGKCASGKSLLAPTDDGIVRVEIASGALVQTRLFAGTSPYVNAQSRLLAGTNGLYVVGPQAIHQLKLG